MSKKELVEASDLPARLVEDVSRANERVLLQAMSVDREGLEPLAGSLISARERGASVRVTLDRYSYFDAATKEGLQGARELRRYLGALAAKGVTVDLVGSVRLNPFAGRNHIKTYITDDTVYAGGGANLTGDTFRTADFMLRYAELPDAARLLFDELPSINSRRFRGQILPFASETLYLVDGGEPGASLIYDKAVELALKSSGAIIASKMVPDGKLARALPPHAEVYYNRPENVGKFNRLSLKYNALLGNLPPNSYNGERQLHAKFGLFESELGRIALTGSHNFNTLGVNFGTKEAALLTRDEEVCELVEEFVENIR